MSTEDGAAAISRSPYGESAFARGVQRVELPLPEMQEMTVSMDGGESALPPASAAAAAGVAAELRRRARARMVQ